MTERAAVLEQHDVAPHDGAVVLQAVDIAKTYGVTRALKGVNFEVRRGKVTVLFGENGAGKSTLMKILSGVEKPTAGQLILDGEPINLESTNDAVERGISIIHQELNAGEPQRAGQHLHWPRNSDPYRRHRLRQGTRDHRTGDDTA